MSTFERPATPPPAVRRVYETSSKHLSSCPGSFQDVKNSDTRCGRSSGSSAPSAVLLNDIDWLVFGRMVFIGMTLAVIAVRVSPIELRKQHHPGVYMMGTQVEGLEKSWFTDDFVKSSKLKIPAASCRESSTVRNAVLFYDSLAYPAASGGECARFRGSRRASLVSQGVLVARRSDNEMKRNAEVGIFTKSSRLGKG